MPQYSAESRYSTLDCPELLAPQTRQIMFYEPGKSSHGLPFDPFKSCVVPRPIGWISSTNGAGIDNLAPFSQFQNITFDPPIVMFSANQRGVGGEKDSALNAAARGEFVWNMATYDLRHAVNITSEEFDRDVDEFERAGLSKAPSRIVKVPRVAESPIQFECVHLQTIKLPGNGPIGSVDVVFGRVVAIHIADHAIVNGRIDVARLRPLARLGYYEYCCVDNVFEMRPPGGVGTALSAGLEGSADKVREFTTG
jgi:flavin reductase (DIM6/NTAB) family NADH-FMN oxidoreductase RutF